MPQDIAESQTATPELLISSPVTSSQQHNQPSPIPSETSQLREELKELKTMMLAMQHRSISQHESVGNMSTTTPTPATDAPSQPFLLPSLNHNIAPITADQSRLHTFQPHQLQLHPSSDHPAISHSDQNNVHFNIGTNQYGTTGSGNFTNNIVNNLYTPPAVDERIMPKTLKAEYVDFDTLLPTSIPTTDQQLIDFDTLLPTSIPTTDQQLIGFDTLLPTSIPTTDQQLIDFDTLLPTSIPTTDQQLIDFDTLLPTSIPTTDQQLIDFDTLLPTSIPTTDQQLIDFDTLLPTSIPTTDQQLIDFDTLLPTSIPTTDQQLIDFDTLLPTSIPTTDQQLIDFDTLLPTSIPTTDQQLIGIQVISEDNFHITTNHKPKNKLTDFPSWMCAWNLFTQATLYNHPHQQHNLFSYQKHFCYLIRRFKFEACYSYDKAQRKQIASQIRVPPTSRTATWDKRKEELYDIFLMDSSIHLPTCYICKNTGHYSSYCPQKQSENLPFTRMEYFVKVFCLYASIYFQLHF